MSGYRIIDRRGTSLGQPQRRQSANPSALSSWGLYAHPSNSPDADSYRPRSIIHGGDYANGLNSYELQILRSFSRQIFAQVSNVSGAIIQKNLYAVGDGWKPQFTGIDTGWGQDVERWGVDQWYQTCDMRGPPYDFVTGLYLDGITMDVDGDALMVLTENDNQYPQITYYPSHRIGQYTNDGDVNLGAFKDAKRRNGVIFNRYNRAIGYTIIDDSGNGKDISAFNAQLLYEPEWQNQDRGIARIGKACLPWFNLDDINNFIIQGVKLDNSVGLMHTNEAGEADSSADIIAGRDAGDEIQDVKIEKLQGGEIYYFKSGTGEKLESFKSDRPHPNTEEFVKRIESSGMIGLGWFRQLLDPSTIGGASVRMIQDEARHSIKHRQRSRLIRAKRAWLYAVAKAMKVGLIPKNKEDWWKWEFQLPPQLTVDEGYSEKADNDALLRGTTTQAAVCGKHGTWWEDVDAQREREARSKIERAQKIAKDLNVPFTLALNMLWQPSANPLTPQTTEEQPTVKPNQPNQ